jgi:peptide/nickel transport system substrate-binding protein
VNPRLTHAHTHKENQPVPRHPRYAALVAAAAITATALTACGASTAPAKTTSINALGTNDINPQARDKIVDGGALTWPEVEIPANFNVNEADGTDQASYDVIGALLPQPYYADAKGVPQLNTNLLTSAAITATTPKQVITLTINPKAVWYDGTPITEADFAAQWKALNGSNPNFNVAGSVGYNQITSVAQGVDERQVVLTFSSPFSDWKSLFAPLYPASTNQSPDAFSKAWAGAIPTSAGPFKLGGIDQTAKTITLLRNEKWWGQPAKLDKIIYRVIDLDAQSDALVNGEIDLQIGIGSHVAYYAKVLGKPGITVHRAAGPVWANLTLNGAGGPLADVQVRNAITVGINRQEIVKAIISPLGVTPTVLDNHVYFLNQNGYQDNSGPLGVFQPQRAGQLLDQAGWKLAPGATTRTKDGKPLTLRFLVSSTSDTTKQVGALVQNQLAKIGVAVAIQSVPGADFYNKYVNTGDFDIAPVTLGGNAYPISTAVPVFANPTRASDGSLNIQQNYSRIGTPQIDQLLQQAGSTLDPTQAIAYANQADAAIWKLDAIIPLYQRPQIVATKSTLANYGAPGVEDTIYENLGFVKK